jgi:hypothetical protein
MNSKVTHSIRRRKQDNQLSFPPCYRSVARSLIQISRPFSYRKCGDFAKPGTAVLTKPIIGVIGAGKDLGTAFAVRPRFTSEAGDDRNFVEE